MSVERTRRRRGGDEEGESAGAVFVCVQERGR